MVKPKETVAAQFSQNFTWSDFENAKSKSLLAIWKRANLDYCLVVA